MTLAILGNAILGFTLLAVMLILLAGAIRLSRVDGHRLALAARRRQARARRRAAPRRRASWAPRTDAS